MAMESYGALGSWAIQGQKKLPYLGLTRSGAMAWRRVCVKITVEARPMIMEARADITLSKT